MTWVAPVLAAFLAAAALFLVPGTSHAEAVRLQLKWRHQFQFAGYYAALEKGFYKEAGLDVEIVPGGPGRDPINEVVSGKADFGVSGVEVLLASLDGAPVVVLAAIFQHSPAVLMSLKSAGINSPHDLIGRRIMISEIGEKDIWAMLLDEGVDKKQFQMAEATWDLQELIDGRIDATAAYSTNTPYFLIQKNIPFNLLRPRTYGVDFYGDCLITRKDMVAGNRDLVEGFRRASLRGWEYAMEHPEEIIDLILEKYNPQKSRDHLLYEARAMRELILPELVQIGHINPGRWRHIADTYAMLGMAPSDISLEGFIYDPEQGQDLTWVRWSLIFLGLVVVGMISYVLWLRFFNVRLRRAVDERTSQLSELNKKLNREIEEKGQVEKSLRVSEEKYRNLLENFPNGAVVMFDHDLRYDFVGGLGLKEVGLKKEKMEGRTIWEIFDPETCQVIEPQYRKALAGEASVVEIPFEDRVFEVRAIPVFDLDKSVLSGIALTQDITPRKKVEQDLIWRKNLLNQEVEKRSRELEESESRYRTLFETMAQGVVYQDSDGQIIAANPSAERMLGLTLDQMQGRTSIDPEWRVVRQDKSEFPGEEHPAMVALKTGREVQGVIMGVFNPENGRFRLDHGQCHARIQVRPGKTLQGLYHFRRHHRTKTQGGRTGPFQIAGRDICRRNKGDVEPFRGPAYGNGRSQGKSGVARR